MWKAIPPHVVPHGAVGAGDAMVAGLAIGFAEGARLVDGLRLGTAAGAATADAPASQPSSMSSGPSIR